MLKETKSQVNNLMFSPTALTVEISEPSQPTERQNTALYSADYEVINDFSV